MKRDVLSRFAFTPRVGVRIETFPLASNLLRFPITPRVGVRIEMLCDLLYNIQNHTPRRVCGLKLACMAEIEVIILSHPSWVCGLKRQALIHLVI